ncbi:hypothetical protein AVEN_224972-1, partial [Araneus ventricosus]
SPTPYLCPGPQIPKGGAAYSGMATGIKKRYRSSRSHFLGRIVSELISLLKPKSDKGDE